MAKMNFYLQSEMENVVQIQVPTLSCISLFPVTVFLDLNLTRYAQLQTPRYHCPELFYNVVIFFGRSIVVFAFLSHTKKYKASNMDLECSLCLHMDCGS